MIEAFRPSHPRITIDLNTDVTSRPLPALLDGMIDVALVNTPLEDARITYAPLFEDELVLLAPPEHPLATRPFVEAHELVSEHFILHDLTDSYFLTHFLHPVGVRPRRLSQVRVTEGILEMVKAGLGLSVLARWTILPELEAGTLAAVSIPLRAFTSTGWPPRSTKRLRPTCRS